MHSCSKYTWFNGLMISLTSESLLGSNLFLACLKINYHFFLWLKIQSVVALLHSSTLMILNNVFFSFFQSILWIVDLTNESAKSVTNAISWCQWFSFLFVYQKISLYTANAINFNWILSWSCISVCWGMFYFNFSVHKCKFTFKFFHG